MVHRIDHKIKPARQLAQLIEHFHMVRPETTGLLRFDRLMVMAVAPQSQALAN